METLKPDWPAGGLWSKPTKQQLRDQAYEVYQESQLDACAAYRVILDPAYQTLRETLATIDREAVLEEAPAVAKAQSSE